MSAVQPTVGEIDRAGAFIAICRWTYAKTVPQHPHEYSLRSWLTSEQQEVFDWFVALIAQHGYPGHAAAHRRRQHTVSIAVTSPQALSPCPRSPQRPRLAILRVA